MIRLQKPSGEKRLSKKVALHEINRRNMAKKLYVGNLSWGVKQETLQEEFSKAGAVESATIIMDRMTGRSKGFGFVEMATEEDAQKAIEMFNGKELDGRALTVNEARPMEARPPRREGGFNRGEGRGRRDNW